MPLRWEDIIASPKFNGLDDSTKTVVLDKFYNDRLMSRPVFQGLPKARQMDIYGKMRRSAGLDAEKVDFTTGLIDQGVQDGMENDGKKDVRRASYRGAMGAEALEGLSESFETTFDALDSWSNWLAKKTGLPKGGMFGELAKGSRQLKEKFSKYGFSDGVTGMAALGKYLSHGAGYAAGAIPQIAAVGLPAASAIMGGAQAIEQDENVAGGTAEGLGEGILLHATLKGIGILSLPLRTAGGGVVFGGLALKEELKKPPGERDWEKVIAETLIGAGMTVPGGGSKSIRQAITDFKAQFGESKWNKTVETVKDVVETGLEERPVTITGKRPLEQVDISRVVDITGNERPVNWSMQRRAGSNITEEQPVMNQAERRGLSEVPEDMVGETGPRMEQVDIGRGVPITSRMTGETIKNVRREVPISGGDQGAQQVTPRVSAFNVMPIEQVIKAAEAGKEDAWRALVVRESEIPKGKTELRYSIGGQLSQFLKNEIGDFLQFGMKPGADTEFTKRVADRAAKVFRGESKLEPKEESVDELSPLDKLRSAFKAAKPVRAETELARSEERRQRIGKAQGILESGEGEAAFFKAKGALKGEYKKAAFEPMREQFSQRDIDGFNNIIRDSDLKGFEKIQLHDTLTEALMGVAPQPGQYPLIKKVFGQEVADTMVKDPTRWAKVADALNLMRAVMTSADMSAPLRQGIILSSAHPVIASKSFTKMVKAFGSERVAKEVEASIKSGKYAELRDEAGLYLAEREGRLGEREEKFQSTLAERIPVIGHLVKASTRSFVTYLNKLRSDVFDKVASQWEGTGKTMEDYRALAKFLNHATGRGDLGKLSGEAPLINGLFFAPRLAISRVQTPADLLKPAIRGIVVRDLAAFVGTGMTILGIAKLGGAEGEWDPRSSDFGKIKIGNTRMDFWGGYLPMVRLAVQLITNERKSTATQKVAPVNRLETVARFLQGKLAPVPSAGVDILRGESFIGEEVNTEPGNIAKQIYEHTAPLFIQDMADAIRHQGLSGGVMALPAFFGAGVQTWENTGYGKLYAYKNGIADQTYSQKWDDLSPRTQELLEEHHPEIAEMERQSKSESKGLPDLRGIMREQQQAGENVFNKLPKDIQGEMDNLYIGIGGLARTIGKGWYMNDERYGRYQKLIVENLEPKLRSLLTNKEWMSLGTEKKREYIEVRIKRAKELAREIITREANKAGMQ